MSDRDLETFDWLKTAVVTSIPFQVYKKTDPYTRAAFLGACGILTPFIPGGNDWMWPFFIGAAAQAIELRNKGAAIVSTDLPQSIWVIKEDQGVVELPRGLTDQRIEGFTFKGLNGVYKLVDGVYARVNSTGQIKVNGIGAILNRTNNGGLKGKDWVLKMKEGGDSRWAKLFDKQLV